jgi:hypothetical protein
MAGFLEGNSLKGLKSGLTALSRFGMKYDDLLVKNSQAIGYVESQLGGLSNSLGDDLMRATMALSDTTSSLKNKSIAFFQLDYVTKRERLRDLASNGEIEFIIETITELKKEEDEDEFEGEEVYPLQIIRSLVVALIVVFLPMFIKVPRIVKLPTIVYTKEPVILKVVLLFF